MKLYNKYTCRLRQRGTRSSQFLIQLSIVQSNKLFTILHSQFTTVHSVLWLIHANHVVNSSMVYRDFYSHSTWMYVRVHIDCMCVLLLTESVWIITKMSVEHDECTEVWYHLQIYRRKLFNIFNITTYIDFLIVNITWDHYTHIMYNGFRYYSFTDGFFTLHTRSWVHIIFHINNNNK